MLSNKKYISIKFSEAKLKKRNRELSILLEISNFLSTSMDLKDLLAGVLSKVLEYFDVEAGRIYLMDGEGQYLNLVAHQGIQPYRLERVNINEGFSGMGYLFEPRSIAVIGASHDTGKIGYTVLKNVVLGGYPHKVYPINPQGGEILGLRVFRELRRPMNPLIWHVLSFPQSSFSMLLCDNTESCGQRAYRMPLTGAILQAPITLLKGAYIIPEIGKLDFNEDGAGDEEGDVTYFGAQWKINF